MKESIGGVWLFGIVITFIVFFTCFVSFSTNYSRAFKVKDEVLASIEHYRGVNEYSLARIAEYMSEIGYYGKGSCKNTSDAELVATASNPTFTYSKWIGFVGNVNADDKIGFVDATNNITINSNSANFCVRQYMVNEGIAGENPTHGPLGHPRSAYYQVAVFFNLDWPVIGSLFNVRVEGETAVIYNFVNSNTINFYT